MRTNKDILKDIIFLQKYKDRLVDSFIKQCEEINKEIKELKKELIEVKSNER